MSSAADVCADDAISNQLLNNVFDSDGLGKIINYRQISTISTLSSFMNKNKKHLNVVHVNVQGLLDADHFELLELNVAKVKCIDLLLISESWLRKNISNKSIVLNKYKIFRCDRIGTKLDRGRGGGVLIYVADHLKAKYVIRKCGVNNNGKPAYELLLLEIRSKSSKILVGCCYRVASCDISANDELINLLLSEVMNYDKILIGGDFNINLLLSKNYKLFGNLINALVPINTTRSTHFSPIAESTLIDIFFTNKIKDVKDYSQCDSGISYHNLIYCALNIFPEHQGILSYSFRNMNKIDMITLNNSVSEIDWDCICQSGDINNQVIELNKIIRQLYYQSVPEVIVKSRFHAVHWFSSDICLAIQDKNLLYELLRSNSLNPNVNEFRRWFKEASKKVKRLIKHSKKQNFIQSYNNCASSSDVWKLITNYGVTSKAEKSNHNSMSINMDVNQLNSYYVNLGGDPMNVVEHIAINDRGSGFQFKCVDELKVIQVITHIGSNACGIDGIEPKFVKLLAHKFSIPLTKIINRSFKECVVPDEWKKTLIFPLPKCDMPKSCDDTRPISVSNFCAKIMSAITNEQFSDYLEEDNLLCATQSGFRRGHSCVTAVLRVTEDIKFGFRNEMVTVAVLIDFRSAFPSIDHKVLLFMISKLNVHDSAMDWFRSYISNRQQVTKLDNLVSEPLDFLRGILQGDANSQTLFAVVIDVLASVVQHCVIHMYADDVIVYVQGAPDDITNLVEKVNIDIANINNCAKKLGLSINPKKSNAIIFARRHHIHFFANNQENNIIVGDVILPFVKEVLYLGVWLSEDLSPHRQVNETIRKVYGALARIRHLRKIMPSHVKLNIVNAIILPIFDYGDIFYESYNTHGYRRLMDGIQRAHNSCLRFALSLNYNDRLTAHRNNSGILLMRNRRLLHVGSMIYMVLHKLTPSYLFNMFTLCQQGTRQEGNIIKIKIKRSLDILSIVIGGGDFYNSLPIDIKSSQCLNEFVTKLRKHLFDAQCVE